MKKTDSKAKKIIKIVFVVLLAAALILLYCIGSFAYVFGADRNGVDIAATGAAIYVDESNSFVWEYQGDKKYDPASTTKLLTCLIAAEQLNMDDKVTVTKEALEVTDTNLFLKEGEKVKVKSLMYLALLESQNEAAKMLAIAVSGSEKKFAKLMNSRAKQLGCMGSTFHNATGLRNPRNYATAKDLCLITEAALDNEIVADICSHATHKIPKTNKNEAKTLKNTNLFLKGGSYTINGNKITVKKLSSVFGGKTGTTVKYKATMCVGCNINGLNVYITILNSTLSSRYSDIRTLVKYAETQIQPYKALEKGTVFGKTAKVKNGAVLKVAGVAAEDGMINLLEGASASLVLVQPEFSEDLVAPISKGDVIGKAVIYLADEPVSSVDILAIEDVPEGWIFSRIGIPNFVALIIIIVLSVILIAVLTVLILRSINRSKARARRNARIAEIARKQIASENSAKEREWPY